MDSVISVFQEQVKKVMSLAKGSAAITVDNVFQEGDNDILRIIDGMVDSLLLPGSGVDGMENLEELLALAESGKSCLLLPEHYSNFDFSLISLLVRRAKGRGEAAAKSLVAIASINLNEQNPAVAAFASAYARVVIYPSRLLHGVDADKKEQEMPRSIAINRAAMKALEEIKTKGRMVLVFPLGTRFRPWDPTMKGVREIDSYIRIFDHMCFVALNGQILHIQKTDYMNDLISKDIVRVTIGPVLSCAEFRDKAQAAAQIADVEDKKQVTVDAIMAELSRMHIAAEEKRKSLLTG